MIYWLVGEKNMIFLIKKRERGGKTDTFTVLIGKNIIWKKGCGAKISYFWEIYNPELLLR